MAMMDKLENGLNRVLVPLATRLNSQRHIVAVRDAFILAFPLTMAGSLILLLNFTVLDPNGFVAQLLQLDHIFPNLANAQQIFSPVVQGTTNIMSIFIVFMIARNMAKHYKQDDLLAGMTSVGSFFIVYTPYLNVDGANYLTTNYLGAQGLFVAMLVGLTVGELFSRLAQSKRLKIRMPEQVPSNVARSFSNLFPIIIILIVFSILNYVISLIAPNGINELIFRLIQAPLTDVGGNIWSVLLFAFLSNLLWVLGIHGPNTLAAVRDPIFTPMGLANLDYIAEHGTTWGVPYPYNWGALNDGFANYGGSGMTLGLLIAVILFSKRADYKNIAKLSIAPGIFNINEPIVFGMPIVLNPIMIIPFILAPMVNILVGYFFIATEIIPPIGYTVPWTTPGPLIPFLGTGGHWGALLVGLLCTGISVLIYAPFVIAANRAAEVRTDMEPTEEAASGK